MAQMSSHEKMVALRTELKRLGVDGIIIPHVDEYQSEYVPASAMRLAWLTGFTGSNGVAVVLPDQATAITDGRYLLQIAEQVPQDLYEIVDQAKAGVGDWLIARASRGQTIGYDAKLHSVNQIKLLREKVAAAGLKMVALGQNPIDLLWTGRPVDPIEYAEVFPEEIAGRSSADKRTTIAAELKEKGISSVVITLADSIAWLLNIRGRDIPHNPVVLSYVILHNDARIDWYVDDAKLTPAVRAHIGNAVTVKPPLSFAKDLEALTGAVQVDFDRSSRWVFNTLKAANIDVKDGMDPCVMPKALKTQQEKDAMRSAHLKDGVALTKLLYWIDQEAPKGQISELDIVAKLQELREVQDKFRETSFETIAGSGPHGAIVHYRPMPETNIKLVNNSLLLIDCGAQYSDGTTDVTRTIAIGTPTSEMKDRFTRVMKGHIAIAMARFPEGVPGSQIDVLGRRPLWEIGLDYSYGTGHGVGCYLCVHEESARLSPRGHGPVKANMIVSNEPGYHKAGEYGIRHENLILSFETGETFADGRKMLAFETLTLAPFDRRAMDTTMLTHEERAWLHGYHQWVYDMLSPYLDGPEKVWLEKQI